VLVGVVACTLLASPLAEHELLGAVEIVAPDSPAEMEALSVKNAAVESALSNNRLMGLIRSSHQSAAVSLSSVEAVRSLSDNELSDMIKNAESHVVAKPEVASARIGSPHPVDRHVTTQTVREVTTENAGNLNLKEIASAFEAHLLQEEAAAKALMAHDLTSKTAVHNLPAPDMMSAMKARLNKEEKAEEDKMNEQFSQERKKTLQLFHDHLNSAAPSVSGPVAHPVASPNPESPHTSHSSHAPKSLANMHMIEHLVASHEDSVNDVQSASPLILCPTSPRSQIPLSGTCITFYSPQIRRRASAAVCQSCRSPYSTLA
jgi:hypothetical protein